MPEFEPKRLPYQAPIPDSMRCKKCGKGMEEFDGMDVKGVHFKGIKCPVCNYFEGKMDTNKPQGGKRFARGASDFEKEFKGRIRPMNRDW